MSQRMTDLDLLAEQHLIRGEEELSGWADAARSYAYGKPAAVEGPSVAPEESQNKCSSLAADVQQPAGDSPAPAQRNSQTPEQLADLVQRLGSPIFRERERAVRELRDAIPASLPHILEGLRSNDLETQRRCELMLRQIKAEGLPRLLQGLGDSNVNVQNAAARLLGEIPTRDLLEAASRCAFDLPEAQMRQLRTLILNRSSEEELGRLYGTSTWGRSNVDDQTLRRSLGLALVLNSDNIPELCCHLGRNLFERGAAHYTEAARLLERSLQGQNADRPTDTYFALATLTQIRFNQGDATGWLEIARRYLPSIGGVEHIVPHWVPEAYGGLLRQVDTMLMGQGLSNEQRRQIENLRGETQRLLEDFRRRNPAKVGTDNLPIGRPRR